MTEFTTEDQWRSFRTFVAAYLAGMLHRRDVFTISRQDAVMPPLAEFRCDTAGRLWLSVGQLAWSDQDDAAVQVSRDEPNDVAVQTVRAVRSAPDISDPSALRLSGSGPASSVAVLAYGGFMGGDGDDPAREAAQRARMAATIDVDGDVIEAAAHAVGSRAFEGTGNGSIAAIACAGELARLRTWVDPFSVTPKSGYLVGGQPS